ncbi:MAG: bile acid:sodium symporter [Candidatus Omnitrophica bacterium]|nr:bile acid:sodium symporter [Candidatus Omnitrophota bacterium]MCM8828649.1 bile acid:sodium symporter [Candidatus Omnitrophota bacterium]
MTILSTKDREKPFILIGAVIAGIIIQRLIDKELSSLIYLTEIGVFFVIFAVMLPVEIKDVEMAFKKIKPTAISLFVNFIFIPAFSWTMGWLILKNYPDFWAGAILYTLTPCIGWYLIFTDIAKGDVPWGISLLPWNITLQVVLMPLYLYILVGKVVPVEISTLIRSVALFLVAPFVLGYIVQKFVIKKKGRDYFFGPLKSSMGKVKLWALVIVIISMFVSQRSLDISDIHKVGLLILFLIVFFFVLFILVVIIGRLFNLVYEDIVTMGFTTTARNSEAVIGVAVSAFPGHPLVYLAIILGPVVELPVLLIIARIMLGLKEKKFFQGAL